MGAVSQRMATTHDDDDDDASSRKRVKTCENGLSDLNHHVLYLVMMQLGFFDYLSFSGVCKSWKSIALSERNAFISSKPPMKMCVSWRTFKDKMCYLEDFEGRAFKTILPHFTGGSCVGLTCGYLVFFRKAKNDFWLVNPITRHQLYFPHFQDNYYPRTHDLRAILVFSLSVREWVFVVMLKYTKNIWVSIAGKKAWNRVYHSCMFIDVHAFKGKIYTLCEHLSELTLNPEPKLTFLETKNSLNFSKFSQLVSSDENMYVMDRDPPSMNVHMMDGTPKHRYKFHELDFGEMKWVSREKTIGESESFLSNLKHGVVVKPELSKSRGQGLLQGHNTGEMLKLIELEKTCYYIGNLWYFPHECLNVDCVD